MAVLDPVFRYQLDLTGKSPTNLVSKELHTPEHIDGANELLVVPTYGGFYSESVTLRDHNYDPLVRGTDYICTYTYEDASLRTGRTVMGAILLLNGLEGDVYFGGQIVGYDYAFSTTVKQDIAQWYADHPNTRPVDGKIVGKAQEFTDGEFRKTLWTFDGYEPTAIEMERISRELLLGDLEGLDAVSREMDQENITSGNGSQASSTRLNTHIANSNNPHEETPTKLGLDSRLKDYPESPSSVSADDDSTIALPETLVRVIDQVFGSQLTDHENDVTSNPHHDHVSQLGGYTKQTINEMLATRLPVGAVADSADKLNGHTETGLSTDVNTFYDAGNFNQGILPLNTLGSGTANASTLLLGNGTFRDIQSIFTEYDKPAVHCFFEGNLQGTDAEAIAYVRTKYQDINQYPDGSIVLWNITGELVIWNGNDGTQQSVQTFTRCAKRNGWTWEFDFNWGSAYYTTTNYRFETVGTYSFNAVKGTYSVFGVGGGGGGNGNQTSGAYSSAAAGGASGYATKKRITLNTGDVVKVEVGAGGYTSDGQGGTGGATNIYVNGTLVAQANGGGGAYKSGGDSTLGVGGSGASGGGSDNRNAYHGRHNHYLGSPGGGGSNGSGGGNDSGTGHNWAIPGGNGAGNGYYTNILNSIDSSINHGFSGMGGGGSGWARSGDSNYGKIASFGGGGGGVGQTRYGNSISFIGNWFNNNGYGFGAGGGGAQAGIGGMASIIRVRHT